MHELSICRSVADIVARHAAGRRVTRVHLRVGALRQVVPATLVYCWELAHDGEPGTAVLAGSVLVVEAVPAGVRCRRCGAHSELAVPILRCAGCGTTDVVLVSGEEFLVTSFEVATDAVEA
ncbi:hydrogenase maturation nickel metallochaperone HypA [Frankia sp. AiPs1]|uniref:hydrogenase maturation nickel metallochaperone HypA n=1 Tax=Frankia sp. AiPs1 TaxID=573493 RepID=UPI00204395F6|nr:hydrogenase maturation nickel metallochaperone HypA [Frankia sp. AiPs1]MCM3921399.1 hydrogenase maturation nickel metallochaperone HypA [Frankia sp. AiPs1]